MPEFPKEPDSQKIVPSNVRLQRQLWDRLDRIAEAEDRSRNEVISFFLTWACDDYDLAQARKRKK